MEKTKYTNLPLMSETKLENSKDIILLNSNVSNQDKIAEITTQYFDEIQLLFGNNKVAKQTQGKE